MGMALVCSEKRRVKNAKPVAGMCSPCGGGDCVVDVHTQRRLFLLIPLYSRTWNPSCLCALIKLGESQKAFNPQAALTIPKRCNFQLKHSGYNCGSKNIEVSFLYSLIHTFLTITISQYDGSYGYHRNEKKLETAVLFLVKKMCLVILHTPLPISIISFCLI